MGENILAVSGLRKSFGQVEVLKGVDLAFRRGTIHALLGANGAGKSTLLGCLSGAVAPDGGAIEVRGQNLAALTPRMAIERGIGLIYQAEHCFPGLTVSENIFLGAEKIRFGRINRELQNRLARDLLSRLGVALNPEARIDGLSVGARKIVEIARAIRQEPDILILDEPTAALGTAEKLALHSVVLQLAHQMDLSIVYVTHLLDEVEAIADEVTVLRDGKVVWTRPASDVGQSEIASAIAPTSRPASGHRRSAAIGAEVLELEDFCAGFTGPVNAGLGAGECLGVYGLLSSGRTNLLEALAGVSARRSGEYVLKQRRVSFSSPTEALSAGVALVPSDRKEQGLFSTLSALENMLMPHFGNRLLPRFRRSGAQERALYGKVSDMLGIRPTQSTLDARFFSGGNAQKIIVGRWLIPGFAVELLLLDEPTQGIDVGARAELYDLLGALKSRGTAIIVASSDPAEITALADKVLVLANGRQVALLETCPDEATLVAIAHRSAASCGQQQRLQ